MYDSAPDARVVPDGLPHEWDATALSRALHARALSCREAMTAFLDRIDALNPRHVAIVSRRSREALMAEAAERDAELDHGRSRGWMHGMPHAVKDLAATRGLRTTCGSPLFADQIPDADAIAAGRLRAAGAIFVGKTNVPEFGLGSHTYNPVFGTTRNAFDPARSAGGSSGGAAVAVALGMVPVADGSDMMGSLRNPAGWNGIFGMRPSQGRVPSLPAPEGFAHQLATDGPLARTAADLARLLATQAGPDPRAPLSLPLDPAPLAAPLRPARGARIAWIGDWGGHYATDRGVLECCETALRRMEAAGHAVEPLRPDFAPERLWDAWTTLRSWAVAGALRASHADPERRARLKPEARWEVERGLALSAMDVEDALVARTAWHAALLPLLERFDALALPSAACFPFPADWTWPRTVGGRTMDTYHRWMEVVVPGSLSVCPVLCAPAGLGPDGLPMGVQLIGRPRGERALLELARAWEEAVPRVVPA